MLLRAFPSLFDSLRIMGCGRGRSWALRFAVSNDGLNKTRQLYLGFGNRKMATVTSTVVYDWCLLEFGRRAALSFCYRDVLVPGRHEASWGSRSILWGYPSPKFGKAEDAFRGEMLSAHRDSANGYSLNFVALSYATTKICQRESVSTTSV